MTRGHGIILQDIGDHITVYRSAQAAHGATVDIKQETGLESQKENRKIARGWRSKKCLTIVTNFYLCNKF